jgi:putative RNA 2'-phosphotransferase
MSKNLTKTSKLLSLVLRHKPDVIGVTLDENGWLSIDELLRGLESYGKHITWEYLKEVVVTNEKQRFVFSPDGLKIRANQGHSIVSVDLCMLAVAAPYTLYHGTVAKYVELINIDGLQKMNRQHVHLSESIETASIVGKRRGKPIVLRVNAVEMYNSGFELYVSANGVWLTDHVPTEYITTNDV